MNESKQIMASFDDFRRREGQELIVSDPIEIHREDIQSFCRSTGNEEWIHWDELRCMDNGLEGIIAPAFMVPSLLSKVYFDNVDIDFDKLNALFMGVDRLRVLSPITAGASIFATVSIRSVEDREQGIAVHYDFDFKLLGQSKPSAVGDFIVRYW